MSSTPAPLSADSQVYPLIGALAAGCLAAAYSITLNLTTNPDVRVGRVRRSTDGACEAPTAAAEGIAYKNNFYRALGHVTKAP